jgi:hypothetical protein
VHSLTFNHDKKPTSLRILNNKHITDEIKHRSPSHETCEQTGVINRSISRLNKIKTAQRQIKQKGII